MQSATDLDRKSYHHGLGAISHPIIPKERMELHCINVIEETSITQNLGETIITIQTEESEPFISKVESRKGKLKINYHIVHIIEIKLTLTIRFNIKLILIPPRRPKYSKRQRFTSQSE